MKRFEAKTAADASDPSRGTSYPGLQSRACDWNLQGWGIAPSLRMPPGNSCRPAVWDFGKGQLEDHSRVIVSCGCGMPTAVRMENIQALISATQEFIR
jgi:hypothetical protein